MGGVGDRPNWLSDHEQKSWRTLVRTTNELMAGLDADLLPHGISLSEYEILAMVSEQPGGEIRMSALAELVAQSRSRLTHAANRLERRGWVARTRSERDGRGVLLSLTPQGSAAVQRLAPIHLASVRRRVLDVMAPQEFHVLGTLMGAIGCGEPTPLRRDADAMADTDAGAGTQAQAEADN